MLNAIMQVGLTGFTISGFLFMSLKMPEYGLIFNLVAQIFWIYSSWKAAKEAKQWGIFITTIFIAVIVLFGVINYWIL
ncbi:MAG: hypothetical protein HHAS10_06000 [Candidatus Altimarinota bacterium]